MTKMNYKLSSIFRLCLSRFPFLRFFLFSYIILGSIVARDKNDVIPIGSTGCGRRHRVIYNRTGDIWFSVSFAEFGLTLF